VVKFIVRPNLQTLRNRLGEAHGNTVIFRSNHGGLEQERAKACELNNLQLYKIAQGLARDR
jgi:hypothetical protein